MTSLEVRRVLVVQYATSIFLGVEGGDSVSMKYEFVLVSNIRWQPGSVWSGYDLCHLRGTKVSQLGVRM